MGLADFYQKPANTIYTWKRRGKFGTEDAIVSGKPVWYADRFRDPDDPGNIDLGERDPLPVLMGYQEVAAAFDVKINAVEKWFARTRDAGDDRAAPPPPRLTVSYTPIWLAEDWKPFARATNRPYNPPRPRPSGRGRQTK